MRHRRAALPTVVRVEIERLIVDDTLLSAADLGPMQQSLERELAALLRNGRTPSRTPTNVPHVRAPDIQTGGRDNSREMGAHIAGSIASACRSTDEPGTRAHTPGAKR
jgi:hypothetical protein